MADPSGVAAFLGSMPGFDSVPSISAPASSAMLPPAAATLPEPEPEPEPAAAALPALRRQRGSEARAAQRAPAAVAPQAHTAPKAWTAPAGDYDVKPIDLDGSGRLVNIHEDARSNAGGVGGELWDGAIVLARWLQGKLAAPRANAAATVLELGAGTGLVGLSAAVLCGARVLLTDRGQVFAVTQLNAERNRPAVDAAGGSVECVELDWLVAAQFDESPDRLPDARPRTGRPVLLPQHSHAGGAAGWDFVVGSDILYDARMYKVLAKLINAAIRAGERVDGSGLTLGSRTVCALSYSVSPHSIGTFFGLCEVIPLRS